MFFNCGTNSLISGLVSLARAGQNSIGKQRGATICVASSKTGRKMAMESIGKTLSTKVLNSPSKHDGSKMQRVFDDRMTLSEAIEAVTRMIRGYANRGQA